MDPAYLNEFYRFVSTDSILVVTSHGNIIRLYCPFPVKAKVAFPQFQEGSLVWVIRVQITEDLKDVYIIGDHAYFAFYFQVIIETLKGSRLLCCIFELLCETVFSCSLKQKKTTEKGQIRSCPEGWLLD